MEQGKQYYAFISYKREDEKWAKWLQYKLEHYRFPTNINGYAELPKYIRPTFRDTTDLAPGLLVEEIDRALRSSEWLIVICSPRSAKSQWVCKEAQTFIDMGRVDRIIPFVIEGTPFSNDTTTECFPEALHKLTGSREILAANINEVGRDAAAIKVVARMFNLRFDTIWQRWEREQRRRKRWLIGLLTLGLIVAFTIIGLMCYQHNKLQISLAKSAAAQAELLIDQGDTEMAKMVLADVLPINVGEVEAALRRVYDNNSVVLRGHNAPVDCAIYSPDGRYIASVSNDEIIKIWDVKSAKCIKTIKDDSDGIYCVKFTPDGKYIISATSVGIKIWDVESGVCIKTFQDDISRIYAADISNDGRYVIYASTYDYGIKIWDLMLEKCIHNIKRDYNFINHIYISPDSKQFIVADDDIELWDIEDGSCIHKYNVDGQIYSYISGAFSADGSKIVSTDRGNVIRIWDIDTGKNVDSYNCYAEVLNAIFCPNDTSILAVAGDHTLRKYSTSEEIVSISFDGKQQLTAPEKEENILTSLNDIIDMVCYSPDGRFILSSVWDGNIYITDTNPNQEVANDVYSLNAWIRYIAESPTGEILGIEYMDSDNSFYLIDVKTEKRIKKFEGHSEPILSATLSKDYKYIISSSKDNSIKIWSVETGECIMNYENLAQSATYVKITDDCKHFICSYTNAIIKLYNINTGECIRSLDINGGGILVSFDVSPDGSTIAAATLSGELKFISIGSGECVNTLKISKQNLVGSRVAFSPDGEYIISTSEGVKIWNLKSNICVRQLNIESLLPFYDSQCVAYSADGKKIYVGDIGCVRVVDFVPYATLVDAVIVQYK
jgi:WD40 repeat protein